MHVDEGKANQRLMNPITLATLRECKSNLEKVHKIANVFYLPRESQVDLLKRELVARGFTVMEVSRAEEQGATARWCIHAQKEMIPDLEELNLLTDLCVDLAEIVGGKYDGWYTRPELSDI